MKRQNIRLVQTIEWKERPVVVRKQRIQTYGHPDNIQQKPPMSFSYTINYCKK